MTNEAKKEAFQRLFTSALVRHSDMAEPCKSEAMQLCVRACQQYPDNNQSAAQYIKEKMDTKFGGSWHAAVGEQFGFEITHEMSSLLYMFFGYNLAICVWKCS